MNYRLLALKLFVRLADTGSFSQVGKDLKLSHRCLAPDRRVRTRSRRPAVRAVDARGQANRRGRRLPRQDRARSRRNRRGWPGAARQGPAARRPADRRVRQRADPRGDPPARLHGEASSATKSLARRRHLSNQAKVRSTTQRRGNSALPRIFANPKESQPAEITHSFFGQALRGSSSASACGTVRGKPYRADRGGRK